MGTHRFTAVMDREDRFYANGWPELGIASQGLNLDEAPDRLGEAIQLYFKDEGISGSFCR